MRNWLQGLWRAAAAECRGIPDRPQEWITCALMPLVWCLVVVGIFGSGLMRGIPVALVNEDGGPLAREVVMTLDAVPSLALRGFESRIDAEASLRRADTYATIVIPKHFTRDSLNGRGATIELTVSKTYYAVSTILELDIKSALASLQAAAGTVKMTAARGGTLEANSERLRIQMPEVYFMGNTAFNFSAYLIPTLVPGLLALAAALTFGGLYVREWRDGGIGRLTQTAGGSPSAALFGKLLPWLIFYLLLGEGWVLGFAGILGWGASGSLLIWSAGTALLILASASIALFFTAFSPTWVIALSAVICFFAPTFPFTGFSYPFDSMTPGAAFFGHLLPLTHYLALQSQCWVLGSPAAHSLGTLSILGLFVLLPAAAGLPFYLARQRRAAALEEKGARLLAAAQKSGEFSDRGDAR